MFFLYKIVGTIFPSKLSSVPVLYLVSLDAELKYMDDFVAEPFFVAEYRSYGDVCGLRLIPVCQESQTPREQQQRIDSPDRFEKRHSYLV